MALLILILQNEHVEKYSQLKPDINLPKSDSEWLTANEYFKFTLPLNAPIRNADSNSSISILNNIIQNNGNSENKHFNNLAFD